MSDCPACKQPMIVLEHENVEVDHCLSCGGVWLDAGELARIIEETGSGTSRITEALAKAKNPKRSDRRCPRCHAHLRAVIIQGESDVEVDRCPKGHGLWLDKGEMDTLVRDFSEQDKAARFLGNLMGMDRIP